jgi:predicted O-methyltransferase YrrM
MLLTEAIDLRARVSRADSLESVVDLLLASATFQAYQKREEIIALLSILRLLSPTHLCEIGSYKGGALALFAAIAAPNARILSIDSDYPAERTKAVSRLGRSQQEITCWQADSHEEKTAQRVSAWLGDNSLDFLFIDGDHSYAGVAQDFDMYSPLVRAQGVIALHDIMPDRNARREGQTGNYTGGVPRFWAEMKSRFSQTDELVEDAKQDGFGIGIIRVNGGENHG